MTNKQKQVIDGHEVYIEVHIVGTYAKVTAIDPVTLTEVTTIGPANTTPSVLQRAAVNKLRYTLNKKSGGDSGNKV